MSATGDMNVQEQGDDTCEAQSDVQVASSLLVTESGGDLASGNLQAFFAVAPVGLTISEITINSFLLCWTRGN